MSYKVTAPLVIIPNADGVGGDWYGYKDAVVPVGLNDARCEQLAKEGMLEKVSAAKASDDLAGEQGPPAKSASKGDWEAYARSQGASDEDLAGATKDDLIAQYGGE